MLFNYFSSQFIELYKDINEEIDLDNFGILICTYERGQYSGGRKYLTIRMAIRLDNLKMAKDSHHGVISPIDIGVPLLVPEAPDPTVWRFLSSNDLDEWLKVPEGQFLLVLLTYDTSGQFFQTYELPKQKHRLFLKDETLKYAQENTIDSVVLTSATGPLECPLVQKVLEGKNYEQYEELAKFLKLPTSTDTPPLVAISMNRCGSNRANNLR